MNDVQLKKEGKSPEETLFIRQNVIIAFTLLTQDTVDKKAETIFDQFTEEITLPPDRSNPLFDLFAYAASKLLDDTTEKRITMEKI